MNAEDTVNYKCICYEYEITYFRNTARHCPRCAILNNGLEAQAEISFKAGIKEGVRRAYEDMKALHRITGYNLDACVKYLEDKYGG